mgnify:CR=1 FL=1
MWLLLREQIALDKGIRTGWGGPTVDRNGEQRWVYHTLHWCNADVSRCITCCMLGLFDRPRDEVHPWYPFKMLSNGQNDPDTF